MDVAEVDLFIINEEEVEHTSFILDYINTDTSKYKSSKLLIFVKMNKNCLTLGRGADSDITFSDLSISRKHSSFRLSSQNDIYLSDEESKFGTLLLQQSPILINNLE